MNYIGLDLGSSSIKGVLMDDSGAILAESTRAVSLIEPREGFVELDPERHYADVCHVINELAFPVRGEVAGIAMAAASGNTLLADESGVPLTNIISWMDTRSECDIPPTLAGLSSDEVRNIVGWPCVAIFPLAHLAWLKENESAIFADESTRYCMNTDWLLFKLTGEWRMDRSTATTFHLQNQVAGKYHKPFLDMLEIDERKLSTLVDSGTVIGPMTQKAAEECGVGESTLVVTGSFDHPAAARGVGIETSGQLLLSCGTSWVGFFPEMDRDGIIESELLCDPFLSGEGGPWGAIFSIPQIGRSIDWYVENQIALGEDDKLAVFDETAKLAEPGAGGLIIYLLEKPRKISASKENVARAVMEGAANLLKSKLDLLESKEIKFERAVMVGGPSKSPIWPGIVEDITGIKVTIGSQFAGAIGAAKLVRM